MTQETVVRQFNDCINSRDLGGLGSLMTDDHAFIDSASHAIRGKENVLKAWQGFFEAFPDYTNVFEVITAEGSVVTVIGRSICADARLNGPALWTAKVRNDQIAEWRVYQDTPENRKLLGITAA